MSIEIETKADFEVECDKCGSALNAKLGGQYSWSRDVIKIEPCEQCIEDAIEKAQEAA